MTDISRFDAIADFIGMAARLQVSGKSKDLLLGYCGAKIDAAATKFGKFICDNAREPPKRGLVQV